MTIPFTDVAEPVIVVLPRRGESCANDVVLLDDVLEIASDVIAAGLQSFRVGRTARGKNGSRNCPAITILIRDTAG